MMITRQVVNWVGGPPRPYFDYRIADDVVVIRDLYNENNPTMSVTNGVEYVIEAVIEEIGHVPPRWIYRDTEGVWDELRVAADGEFLGFGPLGESGLTESEAIERIRPYEDH